MASYCDLHTQLMAKCNHSVQPAQTPPGILPKCGGRANRHHEQQNGRSQALTHQTT